MNVVDRMNDLLPDSYAQHTKLQPLVGEISQFCGPKFLTKKTVAMISEAWPILATKWAIAKNNLWISADAP